MLIVKNAPDTKLSHLHFFVDLTLGSRALIPIPQRLVATASLRGRLHVSLARELNITSSGWTDDLLCSSRGRWCRMKAKPSANQSLTVKQTTQSSSPPPPVGAGVVMSHSPMLVGHAWHVALWLIAVAVGVESLCVFDCHNPATWCGDEPQFRNINFTAQMGLPTVVRAAPTPISPQRLSAIRHHLLPWYPNAVTKAPFFVFARSVRMHAGRNREACVRITLSLEMQAVDRTIVCRKKMLVQRVKHVVG